MRTVFDAIVIGGDANGLVAAAALAQNGRQTLVLERAETCAGQARSVEIAPGFRAAPLGMDAEWLPPSVQQGLQLTPPELTYAGTPLTVLSADGAVLPLPPNPVRAAESIRPFSHADAARWPAFILQLQRLAMFLGMVYQLPAPDIATKDPGEISRLLGLARRFRALGKANMAEFLRLMPMPVHDLAEDWFETLPLRAGVSACGIRDSRFGPRAGGTAFILLHNLIGTPEGALCGRGWWRAGPAAFVATMEAVARNRGVTIHTNAGVARVDIRDDAVTGVVLEDGREFRAPVVLSAADPAVTLLRMVEPRWLDPELLHALRNIRFRGCTSFVLYALDALPEIPRVTDPASLLTGRLSLTADPTDLERGADAVKYGRVAEPLHIELTVPSLRWPDQAPPGRHVLVARAHYSPWRLRDGEWTDAMAAALRDAVTKQIENAIPCFPSRVLHTQVLTPRDVERHFNLTEGAATHGELALDQILFMRPLPALSRYATPIDGLYLCGSGSHPGPGIAGGSGWLAANTVLRSHRRRT